MKLVTYESRGKHLLGAVLDGRIVDLSPVLPAPNENLGLPVDALKRCGSGIVAFLAAGAPAMDAAHAYLADAQRHWHPEAYPALRDIRLCAPVPRPGKVVAIGRNYADHAAETGVKPFEQPRVIAKLPSSVVGPGAAVERPEGVAKLDYEIELGVVLGKRTKRVARAQALESVAGYTVLNDVSAREFQFDVSPAQTTFAKSMDGF